MIIALSNVRNMTKLDLDDPCFDPWASLKTKPDFVKAVYIA